MMRSVMMVMAVLWASTSGAQPKARWVREEQRAEERAEKLEQKARAARMTLMVAVAEALELSEAQALKVAEKLKALDEKRRPIRESMAVAMRAVRAASEGDSVAMTTVDQNMQKVLEGRVQMAALDKELFASLAEGQPPQKKAKLALVLAHVREDFRAELRGGKGRHR
jgi:hypothetical protein